MSIWGTQPEDINRAEDRDLWYDVLTKLDIKQPPGQLQVHMLGTQLCSQRLLLCGL